MGWGGQRPACGRMLIVNRDERLRMFELIANPPAGSKIAAAKEHGIDLTLLAHNLCSKPDERIRQMESALCFLEDIHTGGEGHPLTDLRTILFALVDSQVSFIVVGSYAAYVHGIPYASGALDICYERAPDNLRRLAAALGPFHVHLRSVADEAPFTLSERALAHGMNFALRTRFGAIDLRGELSGIGSFPELSSDAISVTLDGRIFRVASLEAIIRSKKTAGRPKDLIALPELEMLKKQKSLKRSEAKFQI